MEGGGGVKTGSLPKCAVNTMLFTGSAVRYPHFRALNREFYMALPRNTVHVAIDGVVEPVNAGLKIVAAAL